MLLMMERVFVPKVHQRRWTTATSIAIVNLMLRADALKLKSCAESCDAGMANLEACLPYVLPFVLHQLRGSHGLISKDAMPCRILDVVLRYLGVDAEGNAGPLVEAGENAGKQVC